MFEIKTEILQICEAFNLGSFKSSVSQSKDINGFIKTEFETSTGNYTHFFRVKHVETKQLYFKGQIVRTYFDKQGFSCQINKDEKHTEERKGKIFAVNYHRPRNTFDIHVETLSGKGFFICSQEDVIHLDTHPKNFN